jgi:hypothetical protein
MKLPIPTLKKVAEDLCKLTSKVGSMAANVAQLMAGTSGNASLVAGTVAVADAKVTASSIVLLTRKSAGGTLGNLAYSLSAGVGITISSTSNLDTSVVTYQIKY